MPTTSNFGWTTPADTDLVKDGAAAIRTLGNGIDTSFLDLKGGTTGQNLRKASNTDLDFTFAGDATNTVIDAEGDLLVGDSADTLQRLAIGTTGQVLTVDTTLDGKIKWATAAAGGGLTLINAGGTTLSGASTSVTSIPGTYKNLHIYIEDFYMGANNDNGRLQFNTTTSDNYAFMGLRRSGGGAEATATEGNNDVGVYFSSVGGTTSQGAFAYIEVPNYAATNHRKVAVGISYTIDNSGNYYVMEVNGVLQNSNSAITSVQVTSNGTYAGGKVYIYGEN